ncbi:NAD(P)-binding protein [Hyaloscypha variabilis F]|uniref:NAD(P)-binding protein n=1 Tax=Hyaloscypha variabilis (strain UAMH 11265 / GT02V1 / F) TaxID=1149755 RepID=A0A2J6RPK2_HYAVF|nr:NAD(P)-binding protein [Hyaloscypha variabilis F]
MLSQAEKALTPFAVIGALSLVTIIYKLSQFFYPYVRSGSVEKYNKNNNSWALVTGSSDGIGEAFAHELCSKGFNIILHGRNPTKLSAVQSKLSASFPKTQFRTFIADAAASTETMSTAIQDLVTSIKDINLTVLINNVGGTASMSNDFKTLTDTTTKEIQDLVSINLLFTTHLTRALLPILSQQESSLILNTGSASHIGMPYMVVYSATKGYLSAWGNALSIEMQSEGFPVEVMTVLSGNTQSGQDVRAASLFRPTSSAFAKAALEKVGCGRSVVVGYFWHAVQGASMGLLPEWAGRLGMIMVLRPMKGKNLDD